MPGWGVFNGFSSVGEWTGDVRGCYGHAIFDLGREVYVIRFMVNNFYDDWLRVEVVVSSCVISAVVMWVYEYSWP